jgi:hypothetical protein
MCNLYSYTRSQDEARRMMRVLDDRIGNQPPLPTIFPADECGGVTARPHASYKCLYRLCGFGAQRVSP